MGCRTTGEREAKQRGGDDRAGDRSFAGRAKNEAEGAGNQRCAHRVVFDQVDGAQIVFHAFQLRADLGQGVMQVLAGLVALLFEL